MFNYANISLIYRTQEVKMRIQGCFQTQKEKKSVALLALLEELLRLRPRHNEAADKMEKEKKKNESKA